MCFHLDSLKLSKIYMARVNNLERSVVDERVIGSATQ